MNGKGFFYTLSSWYRRILYHSLFLVDCLPHAHTLVQTHNTPTHASTDLHTPTPTPFFTLGTHVHRHIVPYTTHTYTMYHHIPPHNYAHYKANTTHTQIYTTTTNTTTHCKSIYVHLCTSVNGLAGIENHNQCKLQVMTATSASEVFVLVDDRKNTTSAGCR